MRLLLILFILFFFFSCQKKKSETIVTENPIQLSQNNPTPVVGLEIGNKAPELNLKDTNNIYIKLSSLQNKIVLIDFWASWCGPCKIENINLKNVYAIYKDTIFKTCKGFEIYSVSIDSNRSKWLMCLNGFGYPQYKYNWKYNVIDSGDWNKTGAYLYNITFIPMNFLIDNNGIIIAKNLRDTMVEKTLIKLLK